MSDRSCFLYTSASSSLGTGVVCFQLLAHWLPSSLGLPSPNPQYVLGSFLESNLEEGIPKIGVSDQQ